MGDDARRYYDEIADDYDDIYNTDHDSYPAQRICRDIAVDIIRDDDRTVERILDIGCGTARSMLPLLERGYEVRGFDFSPKMVERARENLEAAGFDPGLVQQGDLGEELPVSGPFDAVISLGAVPHVDDERAALERIRAVTSDGGLVLLQLRNLLFNAVTFNEYTYQFFFQELLEEVSLPSDAREAMEERLENACDVSGSLNDLHEFDSSGSFSNPLTIAEEYAEFGLTVRDLHFHHYHAMLPQFETSYRETFKQESLAMEDPDDWRGHLLASAFLVEAVNA